MLGLLLVLGCKDEPEPEPEQPQIAAGEACDPNVERIPEEELDAADTDGSEELPAVCAVGLACEPVMGAQEYRCATALEIRGRVVDSITGEALEGALVAALNETSEPVTDVVATDACGDYVLPVSVVRTPDGEFAETPKWTLNVTAADHLPFPADLRPALPIDIADAQPDPDPPPPEEDDEDDEDAEVHVADIIDNAATNVALIPLPADEQGGATISGTVTGEGTAGVLVVAEGGEGRAPYAIADASGHYTLFNVRGGEKTIRGYRMGLEITPATVMAGAEDVEDVDLAVSTSNLDDLGEVVGSLNIVNAEGGSMTSVVLVPTAVFNLALERGPVPIGLRDPAPPMVPDVSGAFSFSGVPSGTYEILVAFENDNLVRDPDLGIAGTAIQQVTLAPGERVEVAESFKVTQALAVNGPGAENPEETDATPTLSWVDDSSEDGYLLVVFDALGEIVWEQEIVSAGGSTSVEVPYDGPALQPGMYYQFRATSFRDQPGGERLFISRTEDLRGVFFSGTAPPAEECTIEDTGGQTGGETGGETE
jgi:hypothetical protein